MRMGFAVMRAAPLPTLLLIALIPLGAFMNLCMFLLKALHFISRDNDDDPFALISLDAADLILNASDPTGMMLYCASPFLEAVQGAIPSVCYESVDDEHREVCAVCLCEICAKEEIRRLPQCKHIFHTPCIDAWLRYNHHTCPLCRASLLNSFPQHQEQHPLYPHEEYMASWLALLPPFNHTYGPH